MTLTVGTFSEFARDTIADHFFLNVPYTPPTSVWLALGTNAPSNPVLAGEPVGNNYSRIELGGTSGRSFTAPTADEFGQIENGQVWFFPLVDGGNWGTMVSVNIMDASTGGNLIAAASFSGGFNVFNDGELHQIDIGGLFFRNSIGTVDAGVTNLGWTGEGFGLAVNLLLRNQASTVPDTNVHLGLIGGPIATEAERLRPYLQTATEVSNGGYARVEVGQDTPASGVGLIDNDASDNVAIDADVDFPTITADYAIAIYYVGIFQESVGGVMLGFASIRDGGNLSGFVGPLGISAGKNSFVRAKFADGPFSWGFL